MCLASHCQVYGDSYLVTCPIPTPILTPVQGCMQWSADRGIDATISTAPPHYTPNQCHYIYCSS